MSAAERAPPEAAVKTGYLRKLKTMKKKYFVLRADTPQNSARLEYYDSEKKWKAHGQPKKVIPLKSCFNITRRLDTRQKYVIALYMREECLCLVAEEEEDLASWLDALLEPVRPEAAQESPPHPRGHTWQVNVQKKGLGASRNIVGLCHLHLTDSALSLVKIQPNVRYINSSEIPAPEIFQFSLTSIRRCGDSECFFYMEVGRSSVTGAGELWMHTEDSNIAKSMHETILHAMRNSAKMMEELGPKSRTRSSSANEASRPILVLTRRQTHTGTKSHGLSPSSESTMCSGRSCVGLCISPCENASAAYCAPPEAQAEGEDRPPVGQEASQPVGSVQGTIASVVRERCDSLPSNRGTGSTVGLGQGVPGVARPHSMYTRDLSHSPPAAIANSPLSPHSGAYSTDSAGSSISIDEPDSFHHHSLQLEELPSHSILRLINSRTPDQRSIPEESADDSLCLWQPEKSLTESVEKEPHRKSSLAGPLEMSSPVPIAGSSPRDTGYMAMSPANSEPTRTIHSRAGCNSSNHSRTSSMAEEILDGSSVLPKSDGYVDMEPSKEGLCTMSPAASVSSVTSGTPSTDIRFSEYHLEKVSSYISRPREDEERPTRAYSFGSRPDHIKKVINRPDSHSTFDHARKRAFSVGSRSKTHKDNRILNHGTPPHCQLQHLTGVSHQSSKSSSVPILVGTPSRHYSSTEPLDDLMEMDFSNRTRSTPTKATMPPPPLPPLTTSRSNQLTLSVPLANEVAKKPPDEEGYMDMSPGNVSAGYVEMKPAEPSHTGNANAKAIPELVRKTSMTKSPPLSSYNLSHGMKPFNFNPQSAAPDGYVEMSWNTNPSRKASLPIVINAGNTLAQSPLSSSPLFNMCNIRNAEDNSEIKSHSTSKSTTPIVSPSVSSLSPAVSSHSGGKRSNRHHQRRNSKDLVTIQGNQSQTIFPFSLNSPGSPMKTFSPKAPLAVAEIMPGRKCPVDASSGTLKLSQSNANSQVDSGSSERPIPDSLESASEYMDMIPGRLTTVREINESNVKTSVDKDIKQLINNATKVSGSALSADIDYVKLNQNATIEKSKSLSTHKSSNDSVNSPILDLSYSTASNDSVNPPFFNLLYSACKPPNGSQTIGASKVLNMPRKISAPVFSVNSGLARNANIDSKENHDILSSNPSANKTMMSNPLAKSNNNINQVQPVKKPILVLSHAQAITANFKPIPAGDTCEPRGVKSGSPKPVESVLNRQLAGAQYDNKCKSKDSDGYEIQNGQKQGKKISRPGSASGSRPPSVSSELGGTEGSRPGSVVGEVCRLHYASLELEPSAPRSPLPPAPGGTFTYAEIDFAKSEELKNSMNLVAKSKN